MKQTKNKMIDSPQDISSTTQICSNLYLNVSFWLRHYGTCAVNFVKVQD